MSKQEEYRQVAMQALQLADTASNSTAKMRMLLMAQAWFDLAERAARSPHNGVAGKGVEALLTDA